jgi:hypothetical protein
MTQALSVLVACEFSGIVRDAFLAAGHDAWSCDLLPAERPSNRHIRDDVRNVLRQGRWDLLMVAHPPCTRLCNSGVRWLTDPPTNLKKGNYSQAEVTMWKLMDRDERLAFMWRKLDEGAELFSDLWNADVPRICVENPVMHRHAKQRIRNYQEFAQSVQPWQFGHGEVKRTCFWLKGLPPLVPTKIVSGRTSRVHSATPGPDRWKERSRFYPGIAQAMAEQWGGIISPDYMEAA